MDFFDSLIHKTLSLTDSYPQKAYKYSSADLWADVGYSQVILKRDTAFELDGSGFCLVTSQSITDEIVVIGKDLHEIKSDSKFARIAFVGIDADCEGAELHDLIKRIEFVKYHYFPDGFMVRSASSSYTEGARVSKTALKNGISFQKIGNLMINKLKELPQVKGVKLYYITEPSAPYVEIKSMGEKSRAVTRALDQVMNNLQFDCDSCNLKAICDEVEGMRELHFQSARKEGNNG